MKIKKNMLVLAKEGRKKYLGIVTGSVKTGSFNRFYAVKPLHAIDRSVRYFTATELTLV